MRHVRRIPETWGYVSIRGLWDSQAEEIIDSSFVDADVDTWKPEVMDNLLDLWEKINFSLFDLSVDGMMGKEAQVLLATLS